MTDLSRPWCQLEFGLGPVFVGWVEAAAQVVAILEARSDAVRFLEAFALRAESQRGQQINRQPPIPIAAQRFPHQASRGSSEGDSSGSRFVVCGLSAVVFDQFHPAGDDRQQARARVLKSGGKIERHALGESPVMLRHEAGQFCREFHQARDEPGADRRVQRAQVLRGSVGLRAGR